MTNLLVERAYTYVGKDTPTLFYYHQACWEKAASWPQPAQMELLSEGLEVPLVRGTMRLVQQFETPFGIRCKQCEAALHPEPVSMLTS